MFFLTYTNDKNCYTSIAVNNSFCSIDHLAHLPHMLYTLNIINHNMKCKHHCNKKTYSHFNHLQMCG